MMEPWHRPDRPQPLRRQANFSSSLLGVIGASFALIATNLWPPGPIVYWNLSASLPQGPYMKSRDEKILVGHHVAANVPKDWAALVNQRRYLTRNIPLLKQVKAGAGDRICARGASILINDIAVARRFERDQLNRSLPWWSACITLKEDEFFLMGEGDYSFDGRYFGVTKRRDIIAKVSYIHP